MTKILSSEEVDKYAEYARRAATPGDEKVIRALCQTVRALQTENESLEADNRMLGGVAVERDDLQSMLTKAKRLCDALADGRNLLQGEKDQYIKLLDERNEQLAVVTQERNAEKKDHELTISTFQQQERIWEQKHNDFRTRAVQICKDKADGYRQSAEGNLARETWIDRAEVAEELAQLLEQLK
jgi:hypothetical protein